MNQINYDKMSDGELKAYFLANRQDNAAFEKYMDRLNQRPQRVIIAKGEIDDLPVSEQIKIVAERLSNLKKTQT